LIISVMSFCGAKNYLLSDSGNLQGGLHLYKCFVPQQRCIRFTKIFSPLIAAGLVLLSLHKRTKKSRRKNLLPAGPAPGPVFSRAFALFEVQLSFFATYDKKRIKNRKKIVKNSKKLSKNTRFLMVLGLKMMLFELK
jgi:hypothetical protein